MRLAFVRGAGCSVWVLDYGLGGNQRRCWTFRRLRGITEPHSFINKSSKKPGT